MPRLRLHLLSGMIALQYSGYEHICGRTGLHSNKNDTILDLFAICWLPCYRVV